MNTSTSSTSQTPFLHCIYGWYPSDANHKFCQSCAGFTKQYLKCDILHANLFLAGSWTTNCHGVFRSNVHKTIVSKPLEVWLGLSVSSLNLTLLFSKKIKTSGEHLKKSHSLRVSTVFFSHIFWWFLHYSILFLLKFHISQKNALCFKPTSPFCCWFCPETSHLHNQLRLQAKSQVFLHLCIVRRSFVSYPFWSVSIDESVCIGFAIGYDAMNVSMKKNYAKKGSWCWKPSQKMGTDSQSLKNQPDPQTGFIWPSCGGCPY